jgi:tocopherol O-methyltransferase
VNLIKHLLEISDLPRSSNVLDVGCGLGGTSRYLAAHHGCHVTGITISSKQVDIAIRLSLHESTLPPVTPAAPGSDFISCGVAGGVKFFEVDAEGMLEYFTANPPSEPFGCVWISEALSHLPNKSNFFSSSFQLLPSKGLLVIADWFKATDLSSEQEENDIKPIEDGMLLPKLYTMDEYIEFAKDAGFVVKSGPHDISAKVARTW